MKAYIQRLGRALMLPVACLPAAALFLGIGYWIDPSGWGWRQRHRRLSVQDGFGDPRQSGLAVRRCRGRRHGP